MSGESPDHSRSLAIEELQALGLSTYAARTFTALVSLGEGTAKDVSDVADVPRTRVYDAVEELAESGLVDVQQSSPKRFWAISSETAGRRFEREYRRRVERLREALDALEPIDRSEEQRGVWTVTGRDSVGDRTIEFIDEAEDEIVYMTVAELLTGEVVEHLRTASERGVAVKLAGLPRPVEDDIREEVPGVKTFDSLWEWSDNPAGRLLMTDEDTTLVSVLVTGSGDHPPEPRDETAIWGAGETNSLVVVLRAMFGWRLNGAAE